MSNMWNIFDVKIQGKMFFDIKDIPHVCWLNEGENHPFCLPNANISLTYSKQD